MLDRDDMKMDNYQTLFDLIFFLLQESLWDARYTFLSRDQKVPQFTHERSGIPAVQEACEVDLHFSGVREL